MSDSSSLTLYITNNQNNSIVDIAETCQEIFPFAQVAERHNVPLQRVFDTFSAIIQIPLLRNADDKRRHGSLDAKKAMEKAVTEREAALNVNIAAGVGEEVRRGRGRPRGSGNLRERGAGVDNDKGLLRHAILNNVREVGQLEIGLDA
jgi:hypothetical protein